MGFMVISFPAESFLRLWVGSPGPTCEILEKTGLETHPTEMPNSRHAGPHASSSRRMIWKKIVSPSSQAR